MIAKILKRKISRVAFEPESPPPSVGILQQPVTFQYEYRRPELLGPYTEEELTLFCSHALRPIVTPKQPLPCDIGYAEAINAGKSRLNEDQTTVFEGELRGNMPYVFIGMFDGHGGPGAAVKVATELHGIVREGLEDVSHKLAAAKDESITPAVQELGLSEEEDDEDEDVEMSVDELVIGALESSFWAMDRKILVDKESFRITGGATCMVALFIRGKLYVANAGDSRAVVFLGDELLQLSTDQTPMADRARLQEVAFHRPELTRHPVTHERLFNRHVLSRKVRKEDVGTSVMYKDFYMTGWGCRDTTADDVNLVPLISGRGKQCRLLSTIGVARSLGDHDLLAKGCGIRVKEFLTPQPEVKVMDLRERIFSGKELLVMGTDGLWDVMTNEAAARVVAATESDPAGVAKRLVSAAKGRRVPDAAYWEMDNGRLASGDDVTAIAVRLDKARRL